MTLALGKIYYLIGPSGSGKDTLIASIRQQCAADIVIPRRYITRLSKTNETEQHHVLSQSEFIQQQKEGFFMLSWQANDCYYGYAKADFEPIYRGKSILLNGSRAFCPQAQAIFPDNLLPVYLQISAKTQKQRLLQRQRESEQQIEARIKRSQALMPQPSAKLLLLDAEQSAEQVFEDFLALTKISAPKA